MLLARKLLLILLPVLLVLAGGDAAVAKQDVTVELFYSAAWHDHTTDVYTREQIVINHGAGNEQSGVVPSDASLTFDNRDGEMNPENRKSSLFGLIGHNTPIRITVGTDIRFSGQVVSWKPRRAVGELSSTRGDAWVHVRAQGTIRRLGQGEPPKDSALIRYIRDSDPLVWWPLEAGDDRETTSSPSGIAGGTAMVAQVASGVSTNRVSGVVGGSTTGPFGAAAAVDLSGGGQLSGQIPATSATAPFRFEMGSLIRDQIPVLGSALLFQIQFGTSLVTVMGTEEAGEETFILFEGADTFDFDQATTVLDDGVWHHVRLDLSTPDAGASTDYELAIDGVVVLSGNAAGLDYSFPTEVIVSPFGQLYAASHPVLWSGTLPADDAGYVAFTGHIGETAGARFTRLCLEEDITSTIVGTSAQTQLMGPQYPDTLLNLFAEIARTDAGIIHDTRASLGLTFRTGRSLYNQ